MYIYKNTIYKTNAIVIGLDVAQNTADRIDFETNHKGESLAINNLVISETAFEVDKSYIDFVSLIISPILWSDVKYIETQETYKIYLVI